MIKVKWIYSFSEDGIAFEGLEEKSMTKEELAKLFFDLHIGMIEVRGQIYTRCGNGNFTTAYLGCIEEYLSENAMSYKDFDDGREASMKEEWQRQLAEDQALSAEYVDDRAWFNS